MTQLLSFNKNVPTKDIDGTSAVRVISEDSVADPIDGSFQEILNTTTTAADTVIDENTFEAAPGHGTVVGNLVAIADLALPLVFILGTVLAVDGDTITIDNPMNKVYPAGSILRISNGNLNVVASPAARRIFVIKSIPGLVGDITRVMIGIQDNVAMDYSTFGGIAALTNGCLLRVKNEDGTFTNLFNWKNNGGFMIRSFDHSFQTKAGGGDHSFTARSTWAGQSKRGVVLRLDGSKGTELQLVVQDDLSALGSFVAVAQGHLVE